MIITILGIELLINVILIFILYYKKIEIVKPVKEKNVFYDKTTGKEYRRLQPSYYLTDKDYLDYRLYKKYIKKFPKTDQIIVKDFLDFYNQYFFVKRKEQVKKNNKIVYQDVMQFSNNQISNSEFAYNYENNELNLYFNSLASTNENSIKNILTAFSNKIQKKITSLNLIDGRFYVEIPYVPRKINTSLSYKTGILNLGSNNGNVVEHDYSQTPNILIVGPAGSGKSNYTRYLINQLQEQADLVMVDWKNVDYYKDRSKFLKYFGKEPKEVIDELILYEKEIQQRQELCRKYEVDNFIDLPKTLQIKPKFIILEEYGDLINQCKNWLKNEIQQINYSEKKLVLNKTKGVHEEKYISIYAGIDFDDLLYSICSQGRASGLQVIIVIQRADAEFIKGNIKNNFLKSVFLGSKDTTSLNMLGVDADTIKTLPESEAKKSGFVIGGGITYIEIPYIKEIQEKVGVK